MEKHVEGEAVFVWFFFFVVVAAVDSQYFLQLVFIFVCICVYNMHEYFLEALHKRCFPKSAFPTFWLT